MGEGSPGRGRARVARVAAAYLAAMSVPRLLDTPRTFAGRAWIDDAIQRAFAGFPVAQVHADHVLTVLSHVFVATYAGALALALLALPVAFIARLVARSGVRAGQADPLDRWRAVVAAHPRRVPLLATTPFLAMAIAWTNARMHYQGSLTWWDALPAMLVSALGVYAVTRAGLRAFLAPTVDGSQTSRTQIDADEIVFDAVAVTRETKLAIAAVGAPSLPLVVWIARLPLSELFRNPRPFWAFLAYAIAAFVAAVVFQKTSRVAVGIDGVYVRGTARTRFFAYRDLDEARLTHGDLEVVRKGRVLLRLQLHGEDAARRDAVLARIVESIAAAKDRRAVAAHRMVAGKSKDEMARVAAGGGDYRASSITRDQLWQLVEGATTDAPSRTAAAEALVVAIDPADRARLRIAADRVADPRTRVALERLADDDDENAPEAPKARTIAAG
jgi:hypothetical protein